MTEEYEPTTAKYIPEEGIIEYVFGTEFSLWALLNSGWTERDETIEDQRYMKKLDGKED